VSGVSELVPETGTTSEVRTGGDRPRVAFIGVGESPIAYMTDQIVALSGCDIEVREFGALDGLDDDEIELMRPGAEDEPIFTRRADGTRVKLAAAPLETRIANICARLDGEGFDLIVVLSTLLYREFRTYTPLLHAQRVIDSWFASLSMTDCAIGVVNLLSQQAETIKRRLGSMVRIKAHCALMDDTDHVGAVVRQLKDCDLILLSSVSYTEDLAERISALSGRPVVTAHRVLAHSLRLHLSYMARKKDTHLDDIDRRLSAAAPNLTAREREIVELAVHGLSNKEVGLKLDISHRTVEKHRASAMHKLGVSTISDLMRLVFMLQ